MSQDGSSKKITRRSLLKGMALGAAAVAASGVAGMIVKKAVREASEADAESAYLKDLTAGDAVIKGRKYVVMTASEKRALVRSFEENYRKNNG